MRKVIYLCDYCFKELGTKEHLSIDFHVNSGWVKSDTSGRWSHRRRIGGIKHFCSGQCLQRFFKKLKERK